MQTVPSSTASDDGAAVVNNICHLARQSSVPLGFVAQCVSSLPSTATAPAKYHPSIDDKQQHSHGAVMDSAGIAQTGSVGTTNSDLTFDNGDGTRDERPELVVHFDVNETILLGDDAGGDTVTDCFHKMLAKSAFVQVPTSDRLPCEKALYEKTSHIVPTHWWNGHPILDCREKYEEYQRQVSGDNEEEPCQTSNIDNSNDPPITTAQGIVAPLYTGWDWPTHCIPYYRTQLKKMRVKEFCTHNGSIYAETLDFLKSKLEGAVSADDNGSSSNMFQNILPSFFETLVYLSTTRQDKWTVVFRTFGTDMTDLAKAVTAFAEGRHPSYPHFRDDRLVLNDKRIFRGGWAKRSKQSIDSGSVTSETSATERIHALESGSEKTSECTTTETAEIGEWVYQLKHHTSNTLVASNEDEILDLLHRPDVAICGIIDDYQFWSENECQPWAGKPVWMPFQQQHQQQGLQQEGTPQPPPSHHLLFDDNIFHLHNDSIASVRAKNPVSDNNNKGDNNGGGAHFEFLTGEEIVAQQGIHLIRVPTVEAVADSQWFIHKIQQAQAKFALVYKQPPSD
ncbi:hypothetical protein ACA910_008169 [Epithemia clementina (nom. ined.)]